MKHNYCFFTRFAGIFAILMLLTFSLTAQIKEEVTNEKKTTSKPETPKPVLGAHVTFIWQGEGNIKIKINEAEYALQNNIPNTIDLKEKEAHSFAILKPGKTFIYDDYLIFNKGNDTVYVNFDGVGDDRKVIIGKSHPKPDEVNSGETEVNQSVQELAPKAWVNFIWLGEENVKLILNDNPFSLTANKARKIEVAVDESYQLKIETPDSTYSHQKFLFFDKNTDSLFISLKKVYGGGLKIETASDRALFRVKVNTALENAIKMIENNMVKVTGGSFNMGCTKSAESQCTLRGSPLRKKNFHKVFLNDYYISKFEVTQIQWMAVMGNNPSWGEFCLDCPVGNVSYIDVQEFINKLNQKTGKNYRLPTEAEWEYAARGGNTTKIEYIYSGSNNLNEVGWLMLNGIETHSVGTKSPNSLGLFDMSGNVREWCFDWYSDDYYESSPYNNPQGPSFGTSRVTRGGGGALSDLLCAVYSRLRDVPNEKVYHNGFRLALTQ